MPKEKSFLSVIPKIYRRNFFDMGMFFYVEGQRSIVPAITIEQAIMNYYRYCGEMNYNIESAMTTFNRMKHEYHESSKEDK